MVISTTSTNITVRWDPPEFLGGRNDTRYTLWYQEEGSSERVRVGTVNITVGTVSGNAVSNCTFGILFVSLGLSANTQYTVYISATNGVSGQVMEDPILIAASKTVES